MLKFFADVLFARRNRILEFGIFRQFCHNVNPSVINEPWFALTCLFDLLFDPYG